MGILRTPDLRLITLNPRTVLGRSPDASLQVRDQRVSNRHAALTWGEGGWAVRDLGSRNGTWVDQLRLDPGQLALLRRGGRLTLSDPTLTWILEEDGPPVPSARAEDGRRIQGSAEVLVLPSEEEPLAAVYRDRDGGWLLEVDGDVRTATDGEVLVLEGAAGWTLELPSQRPVTPTVGLVALPSLAFRVSSDEEYVEIDIVVGEQVHRCPSRAFHYLLLTLARVRDDPQYAHEEGWIDRDSLAQMIRIQRKTVDVYVHRARAELGRQVPALSAQLIETRSRTGQIRLGVPVRSIQRL